MKERLDIILVNRGLAPSREKAKALIMSGNVFVKGQREDKAGTSVDVNADISIKGKKLKYVSRGGLKLEKAIDVWAPHIEGKVCIDVGASTGGFTDCMLQNGAAKVYAIDVGTNQLAYSLRQDTRVVCMEKTNIRYVTEEELPEKADFVSIDVAFISLKKVLPPVYALMKDGAGIVCLIKPQFEAGRDKVGKKGVVRDKNVHLEVVNDIIDYADSMRYEIRGLAYSPIRGPEGNIEYLLYMKKTSDKNENTNDMDGLKNLAKEIVNDANSVL